MKYYSVFQKKHIINSKENEKEESCVYLLMKEGNLKDCRLYDSIYITVLYLSRQQKEDNVGPRRD